MSKYFQLHLKCPSLQSALKSLFLLKTTWVLWVTVLMIQRSTFKSKMESLFMFDSPLWNKMRLWLMSLIELLMCFRFFQFQKEEPFDSFLKKFIQRSMMETGIFQDSQTDQSSATTLSLKKLLTRAMNLFCMKELQTKRMFMTHTLWSMKSKPPPVGFPAELSAKTLKTSSWSS